MTHPLHFFVTDLKDNSFNCGTVLELSQADSQHLRKVLRVSKGTEITVVASDIEKIAKAKIVDLTTPQIKVELLELIKPSIEETAVGTLLCGLCKAKACEEIIEKTSELGIRKIIFFRAERSQYNNHQFTHLLNKLPRWQIIAEAACKQSKRAKITEIQIQPDLQTAINELSTEVAPGYVLSLQPETQSIFQLTQIPPGSTIAVGPEGDFSDQEHSILKTAGLLPINLGQTIFRTESAAVFAVITLNAIRNVLACHD